MNISDALMRVNVLERTAQPNHQPALRRAGWRGDKLQAAVLRNGDEFIYRRFPQDIGYRWIPKIHDLLSTDWYLVERKTEAE